MSAPMTPTREQLTAEQAIAQIKRVLETDDGYDTAVSAIERIVAALAPKEAAPMPPSDRRADNPQVRRVYCTAGSGGGKSLMMSAAMKSGVTEIRKANGTVWRRT